MQALDGKMRLADVADQELLFRLIQSIPSPKAEPFKIWMAQVASQRLDQMQDPELSIDQAIVDYKRLGYSDKWINNRIKGIENRPFRHPRQAIICCRRRMWKNRMLLVLLNND